MPDEKARLNEKKLHEEKIDGAVEDTFPASDPPANTPVEGSRKAEQIERMEKTGERGA